MIVTVPPDTMTVAASSIKYCWSGDTLAWKSASAHPLSNASGSVYSKMAQPSNCARNSDPGPLGGFAPLRT